VSALGFVEGPRPFLRGREKEMQIRMSKTPNQSLLEAYESPRPAVERLKVPTAPETAAQAIRNAIITGDLKAGDRLPEQKWAAKFAIGQPTLREAFKELQYQGIVEKMGQRGTYVTQLREEDYRAILEVRLPLEATAFKRAAKKLDPEIEQELSAMVLLMVKACESGDVPAFHANDVAFHRRIWGLAGNKYLVSSLESLCFRLFVFAVAGRDRNWFRAAVQQHQAMLEGLCSGDPERARLAFLESTVRYWNARHNVGMNMEEILSDQACR
jgi:DNA-binding GntR family transcriptional regulator